MKVFITILLLMSWRSRPLSYVLIWECSKIYVEENEKQPNYQKWIKTIANSCRISILFHKYYLPHSCICFSGLYTISDLFNISLFRIEFTVQCVSKKLYTRFTGTDLDKVKLVNSQGKSFKYFRKSGNIFKNRNKIEKFWIFHKVFLVSEDASVLCS